MICDVHAHYTPKNFSEFMGDRFASPTHLAVKRGLARDCQEFRARPGMMGAKEPNHAETQRAAYS